jgi:hypothetical protein
LRISGQVAGSVEERASYVALVGTDTVHGVPDVPEPGVTLHELGPPGLQLYPCPPPLFSLPPSN